MPFNDEQAKFIKEQLMKQLENVAEDKREAIKDLILKMNNEELEEFLIKNKLIKPGEAGGEAGESGEASEEQKSGQETPRGSQCIFCLIGKKQIPSLPLYEDKDYIAVLELNPLSVGHTLLIPKSHIASAKDLDSKAFSIANKLGKRIIKRLKSEKAEDFQVTSSDELKHAVINIIPKYEGKEASQERKPAKREDLEALAEKIGKLKASGKKSESPESGSEEAKKEKSPSKSPQLEENKIKSAIIKLPRRIP